MAIGALIFIPAALMREYSLFLLALFVLGAGLTLLQTSSNPYVVLLGAPEQAAARISFMGILNKTAGLIAPLVFSVYVMKGIQLEPQDNLAAMNRGELDVYLDGLAYSLIQPYILMALTLCFLAILIRFANLPDTTDVGEGAGLSVRNIVKALENKNLRFGIVALFFYMGVEVIAGDTIGLLGKSLNIPKYETLTSLTMAFMMAGYIVGMLCVPRYLQQGTALKISAVLGIILSIAIVTVNTNATVIGQMLGITFNGVIIPDIILYVAALGLANALIWPSIWPIAIRGLGQYTNIGSSLLIMAIAGGALIPVLYGMVTEAVGTQTGYLVVVPCYLLVLFYAIYCAKSLKINDTSNG